MVNPTVMEFFQWGALSGLLEVGITHPMDVFKTRMHVKGVSTPFSPYAGLLPRLVGVVPMRCLFWGTMFAGEKKFGITGSSALAGVAQTMIDVPVENMKIRKIMGTCKPIYTGFLPNCARNVGFALCIGMTLDTPAPNGILLGTTAGIILTQPFDVYKTSLQSGLPRRSLITGIGPRFVQAMSAVAIGRFVMQWVKGANEPLSD